MRHRKNIGHTGESIFGSVTPIVFTGKGWTKSYLGDKRFDEFIGTNVRFTPDDIVDVKDLGRIKK